MHKITANKIYRLLEGKYSDVTTALRYRNASELLVSTILSAQCTDKLVNKLTVALFKKYKGIEDFANAEISDFEKDIKSTGFYKNKAKNIKAAAKIIVRDYGGKVPDTMEELVKLPGVARKTANVVLFHAYGSNEGIAVDTHVRRVSGRLGLTENTDPVKIERDLMGLFDPDKWGDLSNFLIAHGREICAARDPRCLECMLKAQCPFFKDRKQTGA